MSVNRFTRNLLALALLAYPVTTYAATAGPDAFGYTWADSDEPGVSVSVAPYTPTDLRVGPTPFTGNDNVVQLTLPASVFPTGFPYYGASYTSIYLSTNGWFSFVNPAGNSYPAPANMFNAAPPNGTVAFLWNDMTVDVSAPVANAGPTTALNGYTIFMRIAQAGTPATFGQLYITLFNTGSIKFLYQAAVARLAVAPTSIGIENATGTMGLSYMSSGIAQAGANFRDSYAVQFFPQPSLNCTAAPRALTCPSPRTTYSDLVGTNAVAGYNCAAGTFNGNESIFAITVTQWSNLTITLENTDGRSRSAFFMRSGCNEYFGCTQTGTVLTPKYVAPGVYYLVVDGATAADVGSFALTVACSSATTDMPCGTRLNAQATSGTDGIPSWQCYASTTGPENLYRVNIPTGPATLTAELFNKTNPNLAVIVTDAATFDISNPSCLDLDTAKAKVWNVPAGDYLVAVDGAFLAAGSYDLEVQCDSNLKCPAPTRTFNPYNPTPVSGTTVGKPNNVEEYLCTASNIGDPGEVTGYTGGEEVYQFTLTSTATVSFLLDSPNPNLRLMILDDCYEGSCIFEGGCAESLAAGTYHLVVDGQLGASAPYVFTPFVLPDGPDSSYQPWWDCSARECSGGCGHTRSQVFSNRWQFNSSNYCGTGCNFSLFVVVECGTNFHIPFSDVETGHMKIYDVFQETFLNLTATNDLPVNGPPPASCLHTSVGTEVSWEDSGCSIIPCPPGTCGGGSDCRTNGRIMDVGFSGTPNVCGVYRLDFINWGGWFWEVFANCSQDATPQFNIYRDLCSALAAYEPAPEGGISNVVLDNSQCASNRVCGDFTIENIGCLPAAGLEVVVDQVAPATSRPQTFTVDLLKGEQKVVSFCYDVDSIPMEIELRVDPSDRISECSENLGTAVSCGASGALERVWLDTACSTRCETAPDAGPPTTICEGQDLLLNGAASVHSCLVGLPEYRWEDLFGLLPGCDWSSTATCTVPASALLGGPNLFTLLTRCNGDLPACERNTDTIVTVIPNVTPPRLGNDLRGVYVPISQSARFSWASILGANLSSYRLYVHSDKQLSVRYPLIEEVAASTTTASDEGALVKTPQPVGYYQVIGVSCAGDIEGPYK